MGGPIQKDKTFLFTNYEGFRQSLTRRRKRLFRRQMPGAAHSWLSDLRAPAA